MPVVAKIRLAEEAVGNGKRSIGTSQGRGYRRGRKMLLGDCKRIVEAPGG